ncbi:hypothetical protein L1987_33321 [Smallanthus sonchifolius]|uniref:Uncharacterized protein n=1 Tax=Smallanthus sonchifolius TaxID=185202 RepID=A0ACB9HQ66_9ASTR|nr:hypothetical protein L1987_33321 [Smallanthus sonchifolius]
MRNELIIQIVLKTEEFVTLFANAKNCSLDDSFNLICNTSTEPPKLFLRGGNIDIYNISDSELRIFTIKHLGLTFSAKNKLTVTGCDDYALIMGTNGANISSGCFGICRKELDVPNGECSGVGCCQTSIPEGLTYYNVTLNPLHNHSEVFSYNEFGYGFLVEEGSFEFGGAIDLSTIYKDFVKRIESTMRIVLDWVVAHNGTCTAYVNACKGNIFCYDVEGGRGYCCKCNKGYKGNPYLDPGCRVKENRLFEIVEPRLLREGTLE